MLKTLNVTVHLGGQLPGSRCQYNGGPWRTTVWVWPWSWKTSMSQWILMGNCQGQISASGVVTGNARKSCTTVRKFSVTSSRKTVARSIQKEDTRSQKLTPQGQGKRGTYNLKVIWPGKLATRTSNTQTFAKTSQKKSFLLCCVLLKRTASTPLQRNFTTHV